MSIFYLQVWFSVTQPVGDYKQALDKLLDNALRGRYTIGLPEGQISRERLQSTSSAVAVCLRCNSVEHGAAMSTQKSRPPAEVAVHGRGAADANGRRAPECDYFLIGDVAALTSLSVHALRAWERVGLLKPHRSPGGVRQYTEDDIARIRLIARHLGAKGMSRRAVATLLQSGDLRPDPTDYAPQPAHQWPAAGKASGTGARGRKWDVAGMGSEAARSRRLLDAIAQIGEAVAAGRRLADVLTVICRQTCRAFGVSDAVLWLLESHASSAVTAAVAATSGRQEHGARASTLVVGAAYGPRSRAILGSDPPLRVPLDHLLAPAIRARRPPYGLIVDTRDILPMTHPELSALLPATSLLVVPLYTTAGGNVGVLALREVTDTQRFDADDLERAQVFATQAANVIEAARLQDELRTAREQAEAERIRWRTVMDQLPAFVVTCDAQRRMTYASPSYERMLGCQLEVAAPDSATTAPFALDGADGAQCLASADLPLTRALREGQPVQEVELRHQEPDGSTRAIVWDGAPMHTPDGAVLGAVAVGRDVTRERRRAQREIGLAAVTRAALGVLAPDATEEHAARVVAALVEHAGLPVVAASVYLIDPRSGSVSRAASLGVSMADIVGNLPDGRHPLWRAIADGPAFSAGDGAPPSVRQGTAREMWSATGIRAWAVVPLRSGDNLLGALTLGLGAPHIWDSDERAWIKACGDAVALAIENARLFAAARRRTEELEAVMESVGEGITMVAPNGQILVRNATAAALTGRPVYRGSIADNLASFALRDPVTRTLVPLEQTPVYRALRGETVRDAVLLMRDAHGHDRVVHCSSNPVWDHAGAVGAVVTTFRDVTAETHRAHLFERLGQQMGATLDPAAEMRALADALVEVGGATTAAVYATAPDGQSLHLMAARNYAPEVAALVQRIPADAPTIAALALRSGRPHVMQGSAEIEGDEHRLTRRLAADLGIVSGAALPLLARGRVVGVIVVGAAQPDSFPPDEVALLLEVAGRAGLAVDNAQLYQTARDAAAKLEATIEAMTESVMVCDASARVTHMNQAAVTMLGMPREHAMHVPQEQLAAHVFRQLNGQPLDARDTPLARGLRGEAAADYEIMVCDTDSGRARRLRVSYGPIHHEHLGAIAGAVAVGRDVTPLTELERAREEFLAIASHELKTPLTSLLGFVQTARRKAARGAGAHPEPGTVSEAANPVAAENLLLARIERQALRLDRLVGDLLDVVRIQQGRLEYRWAVGDIAGAVAEAVDEQRVAHPERRIELVVPEEPLTARLDADRLGQVVTNLLTNALKYSRVEDPVTVEVTTGRRAEDAARVAIVRVRDRGPGIPPAHLPHVFERFYRVPGVDVQSGSGIGLGVGLHVARDIVLRHGGSIWAESESGQGSTFAFAIAVL
jgi:two-component system phosphate regulon sensor histidine kinase PhoR